MKALSQETGEGVSDAERSTSSPMLEVQRDAVTGEVFRYASHSQAIAAYTFSTDESLRELYTNPFGQIRFGRVLEDLDAVASVVAMAHAIHQTGGTDGSQKTVFPMCVTARIDSVSYKRKFDIHRDASLKGEVTWVGSSSMGVVVRIAQRDDEGRPQECLSTSFVFVARDPETGGPLRVPRLRAEDAGGGAVDGARGTRNRRERPADLNRQQLMADENFIAWADERIRLAQSHIAMPVVNQTKRHQGGGDTRPRVLMADTQIGSTVLAMPQDRNFYGRIFGGFLLRSAFEVAYNCAYLFSGAKPEVVQVGDVSFTKPVHIGDVLVFRAKIVSTSGTRCAVEVLTKVVSPIKVSVDVTNAFYFTFETNAPSELPEVLPSKHDEAIPAWKYRDCEDLTNCSIGE